MSKNLWPQDITFINEDESPATLLREQAAKLGDMTNHLVTASVVSSALQNKFSHSFLIIANELDYSYKLFACVHGLDYYPILFEIDLDILERYFLNEKSSENIVVARDKHEYLKILEKIFNADKTKKILMALVNQIAGSKGEKYWFIS